MGDIEMGMLIAYQGVKEEIDTMLHEMERKGIEEPLGFSQIKQYLEDRMSELN